MARVCLKTPLNCSASRAWEEVRKPPLLLHVARPFLVFVPREPKAFPPAGLDGELKVSMWLLGVIPLGWQMIRVTREVDADGTFHLRDDGYSPLIRRWDHRIQVQPISPMTCEYSDTIDIEAGLFTPLVFVFAHFFFRWRQHRWRQLVGRQFVYPGSTPIGDPPIRDE